MKQNARSPRNHVALALMKRGGSSVRHGKTTKAQRRADKVALHCKDFD